MALSLGIHTGYRYSDQYTSTTPTVTTTVGSTIIAGVVWQDNQATVPVLSDAKGCIWIQVGTEFLSHTYPSWQTFYKQEGGSRGTNHTFTVTGVGGSNWWPSIWIQEILGTSPVVDTVVTGVKSASPLTSNTYTPNSANEILIALATGGSTASPCTFTWDNSFISTGDNITDNTYWQGSMAYSSISSVTGYTAILSVDGTAEMGLQVLGVRESVFSNTYAPKTGIFGPNATNKSVIGEKGSQCLLRLG